MKIDRLSGMLSELGCVSDEPGKLTRTFLSPAMRRANRLVGGWMKDAGLAVREDAVGNLIGRIEGSDKKAKTLLLGSHLDTVRDAGRFDGTLGVLLPIVALAELKRRGVTLPFAVEVIGFSEEEGVRFASAYIGSKGYLGLLTAADLKLRDAEGTSVRKAISEWSRGAPAAVVRRNAARAPRPQDLLGYVEVHIEQGPVLEKEKLAVGVVSAIAGQSRFKLTWTGKAGHAGTTPMPLRHDALAGAAEFTIGVEAIARRTPGLVATVGALTVTPGAANVIPGEVVHTLDVRHARDAVRRSALMQLGRLATRIARERGLQRRWQRTQENRAVACSPALTAQLGRSVEAAQGRSLSLVSGAGHDGVVLSSLTPIAMLFVRCHGGLSHHPDEYASPADCGVALRVMVDFLERMAQQHAR
ncbi:MAG: allantoate amidohydrolase [Opitutaceae bacterium]|nr:allantoate amidohydrolase [Opitutaceae bacterium]